MFSKVILPIIPQSDYISTFRIAFPLCILYTKSHFIQWFYSKCITPFAIIWEDNSSDFFLADCYDESNEYLYGILRTCFDTEYLSPGKINTISNILNLLYHSLSSNNYLIIFVDEYYIPVSINYKSSHYMHEYLIYGIDFNEKCILAIGFNKSQHMSKLSISFSDFITGVYHFDEKQRNDLPMSNTQCIILRTAVDFPKSTIDLNSFSSQILYYIISKSPSLSNRNPLSNRGELYWGLNTYEVLFYHIKNVINQNEPANFKFVQSFYEHKKGIFNRIRYIEKLYPKIELADKYSQNISSPISHIRMLYMKCLISQKNIFSFDMLGKELYKIKNVEKNILTALYKSILY